MKAVLCPVCNGVGKVPSGFYNKVDYFYSTAVGTAETCQACGGCGYLIVPEDNPHFTLSEKKK